MHTHSNPRIKTVLRCVSERTLFLPNSNVCSDDKVWFFGAYKTLQTLEITGLVGC